MLNFSKLEAQSSSKFICPSDSKIKVWIFNKQNELFCTATAEEARHITFTNVSGRSYRKNKVLSYWLTNETEPESSFKSSDVIHSIYCTKGKLFTSKYHTTINKLGRNGLY